jgi:hypothetical protein
MFLPYDVIGADECSSEVVLNAASELLRFQLANEYTQSTMKAVLGAYFDKKETGAVTYYQSGLTIILEPCSDKGSDSQLKNIKEVLDSVDVRQANILIFAVAEEQPLINKRLAGAILSLPGLNSLNPPRNHWVTVHYDMDNGMVTLIDSKSSLAAAWYDYGPLQAQLKDGLQKLGLALNGFKVVYQGVQADNIHCGAWTAANICALVDGAPLDELLYDCSIDDIINAQTALIFPQTPIHDLPTDTDSDSDSQLSNQDSAEEYDEDNISLHSVDSIRLASVDEHRLLGSSDLSKSDDEIINAQTALIFPQTPTQDLPADTDSQLSNHDSVESQDEDNISWHSVDSISLAGVNDDRLLGSSNLSKLAFDGIICRLQAFLNEELLDAEFISYKLRLDGFILNIQTEAQAFFEASNEDQPIAFALLHVSCQQGFDLLTNQFKPRDDLLFVIQTFFKAIAGVLLFAVASILTLGLASIYMICKKDLRQQYTETFFAPETSRMREMKNKWQSSQFRGAFFGEHGWLEQVKLNQSGSTI